MKFKLPRQIFNPNLKSIIKRELKKQEVPLFRASQKKLKELAEITQFIVEKGLPSYLVLKEISKEIGYGIFLHPEAEPIKRGQIIAPYAGELSLEIQNKPDDSAYAFSLVTDIKLKKEEQELLGHKVKFSPNRLYALNLDANNKGNFTRYINHSVKPNVQAALFAIPKNSLGVDEMPIEVIYFARRTIYPGEQLLVCYEDGEESYWKAFGVEPFPMTSKTFRLSKALKLVQQKKSAKTV